MNFIFKLKLKCCTKELIKLTKIMSISLIFIIGIILIKYKPLYKVEINNIEIGYVKSKNEFNSLINEYKENKTENVAFITINAQPKYELTLVENDKETNEQEILSDIKENSTTTYTAYGIALDEDIKTYVSTQEQAEDIVTTIKDEYLQENTDINLNIKQIYSEEVIEMTEKENAIEKITQIADAKVEEESKLKKQEELKNAFGVVNDVIIAVKPISGTITSRYGESSNIRSSTHTGLDIAAPTGTDIKACASGTVLYAGKKGSYGNIVKIQHENDVETWYAHCSKIYVKEGDTVNAGDIIAAVGSTGNSTGSHLHLEIRINGKAVNPQKYIYK